MELLAANSSSSTEKKRISASIWASVISTPLLSAKLFDLVQTWKPVTVSLSVKR